jgi:hypothetical protein
VELARPDRLCERVVAVAAVQDAEGWRIRCSRSSSVIPPRHIGSSSIASARR